MRRWRYRSNWMKNKSLRSCLQACTDTKNNLWSLNSLHKTVQSSNSQRYRSHYRTRGHNRLGIDCSLTCWHQHLDTNHKACFQYTLHSQSMRCIERYHKLSVNNHCITSFCNPKDMQDHFCCLVCISRHTIHNLHDPNIQCSSDNHSSRPRKSPVL